MVSVDVKHHVYLLTYQHYGSEKSRDLHMCRRKPRNGHIPDWKTNEPQTKTNEPQNMSSNIYDRFFSLFFSFLFFSFLIFVCWKFRRTKYAQIIRVNRSDWAAVTTRYMKSIYRSYAATRRMAQTRPNVKSKVHIFLHLVPDVNAYSQKEKKKKKPELFTYKRIVVKMSYHIHKPRAFRRPLFRYACNNEHPLDAVVQLTPYSTSLLPLFAAHMPVVSELQTLISSVSCAHAQLCARRTLRDTPIKPLQVPKGLGHFLNVHWGVDNLASARVFLNAVTVPLPAHLPWTL